jgi:hypothetical protein
VFSVEALGIAWWLYGRAGSWPLWEWRAEP